MRAGRRTAEVTDNACSIPNPGRTYALAPGARWRAGHDRGRARRHRQARAQTPAPARRSHISHRVVIVHKRPVQQVQGRQAISGNPHHQHRSHRHGRRRHLTFWCLARRWQSPRRDRAKAHRRSVRTLTSTVQESQGRVVRLNLTPPTTTTTTTTTIRLDHDRGSGRLSLRPPNRLSSTRPTRRRQSESANRSTTFKKAACPRATSNVHLQRARSDHVPRGGGPLLRASVVRRGPSL